MRAGIALKLDRFKRPSFMRRRDYMFRRQAQRHADQDARIDRVGATMSDFVFLMELRRQCAVSRETEGRWRYLATVDRG